MQSHTFINPIENVCKRQIKKKEDQKPLEYYFEMSTTTKR